VCERSRRAPSQVAQRAAGEGDLCRLEVTLHSLELRLCVVFLPPQVLVLHVVLREHLLQLLRHLSGLVGNLSPAVSALAQVEQREAPAMTRHRQARAAAVARRKLRVAGARVLLHSSGMQTWSPSNPAGSLFVGQNYVTLWDNKHEERKTADFISVIRHTKNLYHQKQGFL
jgi:hypothetical protein